MNAIAGGGSFISFPALLFLRVPPVAANATNTVALWPGLAASTVAYSRKLSAPPRLLIPLLVTSVAGGWAGALLLLHTPQHTFLHLVPWLLLSGTLLFAFGNSIRSIAAKAGAIDLQNNDLQNNDRQNDDLQNNDLQNNDLRSADLGDISWTAVAVCSFIELLLGIYGGYFGAGIGFVMLGMLTALGMRDIHAIAAIRTLLAASINAVAVLTFIVAGAVLWPQCIVMLLGALTGGWFSAHYAQKVDPRWIRALVIGLGLTMSAYFFIATR